MKMEKQTLTMTDMLSKSTLNGKYCDSQNFVKGSNFYNPNRAMFFFPNACFKEILLKAPWRGGESCRNCFLIISTVSVHPGTPTDFH